MVVNELSGILQNIESSNGIYFFKVNREEDAFFALQLHNGCKVGSVVKLHFRENDVSIAKIKPELTSISNIHKAIVKSIDNGSLLARVELNYKQATLHSLITAKSLKKLDININDEVYFLIKALSIEVLCG